MALKVELKAGERFILGNCLITNSAQRIQLLIEGDAPILREKDIMTAKQANTPAKRIYFAIQLMYTGGDPTPYHETYFVLMRDLLQAVRARQQVRVPRARVHCRRRRRDGAGARCRRRSPLRRRALDRRWKTGVVVQRSGQRASAAVAGLTSMSELQVASIRTEIAAPAALVWDVLVDLDKYNLWNPLNRRVESTLKIGDDVKLYISDADLSRWCRLRAPVAGDRPAASPRVGLDERRAGGAGRPHAS